MFIRCSPIYLKARFYRLEENNVLVNRI